jgi:hypothetical protein
MTGAGDSGFARGKVNDGHLVPGIYQFGQRSSAATFGVIGMAANADYFSFCGDLNRLLILQIAGGSLMDYAYRFFIKFRRLRAY